jgi:hypothetical protein
VLNDGGDDLHAAGSHLSNEEGGRRKEKPDG